MLVPRRMPPPKISSSKNLGRFIFQPIGTFPKDCCSWIVVSVKYPKPKHPNTFAPGWRVGKMLEDVFVWPPFLGENQAHGNFFLRGKKTRRSSTFRRVGWLGNTCSATQKKKQKNFQLPTHQRPTTKHLRTAIMLLVFGPAIVPVTETSTWWEAHNKSVPGSFFEWFCWIIGDLGWKRKHARKSRSVWVFTDPFEVKRSIPQKIL